MRVIITGGTGLIGMALVESLARDGHEVIVLSRNPKQKGPLPGNVQFVKWDAKTAEGWGHLADGAGAIVNLAAANLAGKNFLPQRWTDERKRAILESRINSGKAVVAAVKAAQTKPGMVVQSSAVGYYGPRPMSAELTEDSPPGDDFLADVCVKWEASTAEVEDMGVRRVVVRTGVVLSTEDGALPRLALPYKLFAGGPIGSGKQPVPWIHLHDEVQAIRFLIEHDGAHGPFNLCAPNTVTNAQFGRALGRVLDRPHLVPAPGFAFKMAFGQVADVILTGQNPVPAKLRELGFAFAFAEVEAALRDLYGKGEKALAAAH